MLDGLVVLAPVMAAPHALNNALLSVDPHRKIRTVSLDRLFLSKTPPNSLAGTLKCSSAPVASCDFSESPPAAHRES